MNINKNDILFWTGLFTALWFAFLGVFWAYWIALIVAYPIGLVSFFIWKTIQKDQKPRNKIIPIILIVGLAFSLLTLLYLLIFD